MTQLLTFEDALAVIHELGFIVIDAGLLDSAIARPRTSVFGADAYPDLQTKAAALMHSVARNHALLDGNQRTAWTLTQVLLRLNGREMVVSDPYEAVDFMLEVAQDFMTLEAIAKWISDHLAELVGPDD